MIILGHFLTLIFCESIAYAEEGNNSVTTELFKFLVWNNYLDINSTNIQTFNLQDENVIDALLNFQEFYHLPEDGKINNETLEILRKPRCGFPDKMAQDFMLAPAKWYQDNISWHFINAQQYQFDLTHKAFETWQNHSNYKFRNEPMSKRANIVIAFKSLQHNFSRCCNRRKCDYEFDGVGNILAHAYFPYKKYSHIEIHLDSAEEWEYSEDGNFYQTLLHEIGHSLGLQHSSVKGSVMFPYAQVRNTTDLSPDDIHAIQSRYVFPQRISQTPTSSTSTTTTTSTTKKSTTTTRTTIKPTTISISVNTDSRATKVTTSKNSDICYYEKDLKMFLFVNGKFYIFHKDLVWMRNVRDSVLHEPELISNWLTFIPNNQTNLEIIAIYQQTTTEVVILLNSTVYVLMIPSLKFAHAPVNIYKFYPELPQQAKINTMFSSYMGHIYIIYNDVHVGKINSCSKYFEYLGLISDHFPGIPAKIDGAYSYIDGNLYFLANQFIYVYNEFLQTIIETKPRNARSFGIECPNRPLLEQLKLLLNQILFKQIRL